MKWFYNKALLTGAPKITSDLSIRDMTVIAGEEFTITVPYVSNPTPRPTWTINGQEVISNSRIEFKTSANSTVFHNKCAKRATDSGSYTIQLVNNMGSDSASCRVLVVGEFLLYFKANKAGTCTGITLFYCKGTTLHNIYDCAAFRNCKIPNLCASYGALMNCNILLFVRFEQTKCVFKAQIKIL